MRHISTNNDNDVDACFCLPFRSSSSSAPPPPPHHLMSANLHYKSDNVTALHTFHTHHKQRCCCETDLQCFRSLVNCSARRTITALSSDCCCYCHWSTCFCLATQLLLDEKCTCAAAVALPASRRGGTS